MSLIWATYSSIELCASVLSLAILSLVIEVNILILAAAPLRRFLVFIYVMTVSVVASGSLVNHQKRATTMTTTPRQARSIGICKFSSSSYLWLSGLWSGSVVI